MRVGFVCCLAIGASAVAGVVYFSRRYMHERRDFSKIRKSLCMKSRPVIFEEE